MPDDPYARFQTEDLTLRDELAIDRTVLANERTLLAYIRTALGFLVLGLTFQHFLEKLVYHILGFSFMGLAIIIFILGIIRYLQIRSDLKRARARGGNVSANAEYGKRKAESGTRNYRVRSTHNRIPTTKYRY